MPTETTTAQPLATRTAPARTNVDIEHLIEQIVDMRRQWGQNEGNDWRRSRVRHRFEVMNNKATRERELYEKKQDTRKRKGQPHSPLVDFRARQLANNNREYRRMVRLLEYKNLRREERNSSIVEDTDARRQLERIKNNSLVSTIVSTERELIIRTHPIYTDYEGIEGGRLCVGAFEIIFKRGHSLPSVQNMTLNWHYGQRQMHPHPCISRPFGDSTHGNICAGDYRSEYQAHARAGRLDMFVETLLLFLQNVHSTHPHIPVNAWIEERARCGYDNATGEYNERDDIARQDSERAET